MRRTRRKLNRKKTVIAIFASLLAAVITIVGGFSLLAFVTFPADVKPEDVKEVSQYYQEYAEPATRGSIQPENYFRGQFLTVYTKQWYTQGPHRIAVRENEDGSLTIVSFCTGYDALWDRIATPRRVREKFEGRQIGPFIDEPKLRQGGVWVMRPEPPVVHWKVYFINYRDWKGFLNTYDQLPDVNSEFIDGTDQVRPELLQHAVLLTEGTTE